MSANDDDWDALGDELTETFTPGVSIRQQDLFAGRKEQIGKLTDAVRRPGAHAVIYGEAGVGKSSLANTFALRLHSKTKELIFEKVNADPNDTFTSLWKKVFKRLGYQAQVEGREITRRISDDYAGEITVDDVQLELSTFSANSTPIVVLDEFNVLEDPSVSKGVAHTIKGLADYAQSCTIVVVGVAEDVSRLISDHKSISRQLIQVHMPRMSTGELGRIIKVRFDRLGMKIDLDALWHISFLSRGLPYFTHLLGLHTGRHAVADRTKHVTNEHLQRGISTALSDVDESLSAAYAAASLSKKKVSLFEPVLLACALAEPDEWGRFSQGAVEEPLFEVVQEKRYKATTYAFHMNLFCEGKRGAVLERLGMEQAPRYRFQDPMMQPYVILRGIGDGLVDEAMRSRFTPPRPPSFSSEIEQPS